MKVALACDHRGYEWKERIADFLRKAGHEVEDCGSYSGEACDYPDTMFEAAGKVASGRCDKAIGVCYTGIGSTIAANKVKGVRAALCHSAQEAELSRAHNDSNMLVLGAGFVEESILESLVEKWLNTAFEGGRHEQRVNKIREYEQRN